MATMTNTDEKTYTLAQARVELQRLQCATYGHSWNVVETMECPIAISCDTCGVRYAVVPKEQETHVKAPRHPPGER